MNAHAALRAAIARLEKGAVREHQRRTRTGKTITVRAHDRKSRVPKGHVGASGLDSHDTHLRRMEDEARSAGHHEYADHLAVARVTKTHGPVEGQIRAAYRNLDAGRDGHVSLAELRQRLHPDIPRSHVDAALTAGFLRGHIHLRPNENTKAILPEEHAAAIHLGEKARHLIRVKEH